MRRIAAILGWLCLVNSAAAQLVQEGSVCGNYYSQSTRNISVEQRQLAEQSFHFSQHCERNGEARQSSLNANVDAIVKGIPFNFGLGSADAKQKLQEFCRYGASGASRDIDILNYRNEVVEAAYRGLNECLTIEKLGLRVSHAEQVPEFVYINILASPVLDVSLDSVATSEGVTCSSTNFSQGGGRETIDGSKKLAIKGAVNLQCQRTPLKSGNNLLYRSARIGISTSLGPYTVSLPEDTLYGIELASDAQRRVDVLNREVAAKNSEIAALLKRMQKPEVTVWRAVRGENHANPMWFPVHLGVNKRNRGANPPEEFLKKNCNDKGGISSLETVGGHGGNCCGYTYYVLTCVRQ